MSIIIQHYKLVYTWKLSSEQFFRDHLFQNPTLGISISTVDSQIQHVAANT